MNKLQFEHAYSRTRDWVTNTTVLTNTFLDELFGAQVLVKCEQFQPVGAFKIRGASNFVLQLTPVERTRGLTTHSSGNHAQAVAYVAHKLKIPCWIVMPENANKLKVDMARKWGSDVSFCESTTSARIEAANALVSRHGGVLVPPFDHEWIIQGQGTCAMEILCNEPRLDALVTPLGGGGLLAGSILAGKYFGEDLNVYGVEPETAADGLQGVEAGKRVTQYKTDTIADGLRTTVGEKNFSIIQEGVTEIWTCSENEIMEWMYRIWMELKIIIEPSSAVVFAAAYKHRAVLKGKRVGIIVTGGNVDFSALPRIN